MNKLIWKLLRSHISPAQLAGFFLANLFGMLIVLLSLQFYYDIIPLFTRGDSFMKQEYLIVTKQINTLGSLTGKNNTFSEEEIAELKQQDFTKSIGTFTPSLFNVSAGLNMQQTNIRLSTEMFFEAVPDEYVDVDLKDWNFTEGDRLIPIIIPRNYLNLYNFGFAQSRNLPKLSEGLMGLINMNIQLYGNGQAETFKGEIAGFSNRLNTILVPQSFMDWANKHFAPGQQAHPSRLIVEVKNPTDPAIAEYFSQHRYETEGEGLNAGKTTSFLRMTTAIIMGVGLVISALSFYILMLSIFLLLQKNSRKLQNLLLIGYSPANVTAPYCLLTIMLNLLVLILALCGVAWLRAYYMDFLQTLFPQMEAATCWPSLLIGMLIFALVSLLNVFAIRRKIDQIWKGQTGM